MFIPILLTCAMPVSLVQSAEEAAFRIDKIESGSVCWIVAVNKSVAPITAALRIAKGAQYRSDRTWPLYEVIAPNSTHEIARIVAKENKEPCRVEMTYSHSVGNAFAVPDRHYRYRLPFKKGTVVRVTQEPNGVLTTHKDALSRYAVDFSVPQGTPVFAARAGIVIEIRDTFDEGRFDPKLAEKTNLVSIVHSDGTFAQYAHLAPHSVLVRPDERVEAGQMVGKSGSSGYAGGPHLHFDLRRARIGADGVVRQESLPFSFFRQGSGKKITLRQRMRITVD
ncbi:MAG: M23 family metallopeptidase [Betaproteobacteria bacterium]|nr:M23 family metallopeptidase [Betaproteobacteria bacterium]